MIHNYFAFISCHRLEIRYQLSVIRRKAKYSMSKKNHKLFVSRLLAKKQVMIKWNNVWFEFKTDNQSFSKIKYQNHQTIIDPSNQSSFPAPIQPFFPSYLITSHQQYHSIPMKPSQSPSATKLLNKKLNINSMNTPKYIQSKIYISTKQLNHPNNSSMKKVIDTKLDLIKQEISRQISQHYSRRMSGQNVRNHEQADRKSQASNQNKSRKVNRSRARSEKNPLSCSNSASRIMGPYSKGQDRTLPNSKLVQYDYVQPRRLFDQEEQSRQMENITRQFGKSCNSTKILASSLSKINIPASHVHPNSGHHEYKEKFLVINEKYLDQKAKGIDRQAELLRLKSSIQNFALRPDQTTLHTLLKEITHTRSIKSQMSNYHEPSQYSHEQYLSKEHNRAHVHSELPQIQKVEESLRYLLTCYEDIEEFKQQLEQLLSITGTSSLQELKELISYKFEHTKPIPQSMDQFTYRFLELESNNHRLKSEYEQMIQDMRQKAQLEAYHLKRTSEKEISKLNKIIEKAQNQIMQNNRHHELLLQEMGKMAQKYAQKIQQIQSQSQTIHQTQINTQNLIRNHQNQPNQYLIKTENVNPNKFHLNSHQEDSIKFYQKIKKLSEFQLYQQHQQNSQELQHIHQQSNHNQNQFTPKYSFKPNQSNNLQSDFQSSPQSLNDRNVQTSIEQRLPPLPHQLKLLDEVVEFLLSRVMETRYEVQDNIKKLRQANEGISLMDEKLYQIKYELEDQIKDLEERALEKDQTIKRLSSQLSQMTDKQLNLNQELNMSNQKCKIKELQNQKLANQIETLKKEIFDSNKKTIQFFAESCSYDEQKKSILELVQEEFYSFNRKITTIDLFHKQNPQNPIHEHSSSLISHQGLMVSKPFPILPQLPQVLSRFFTQLKSMMEQKLVKTQQYHKLFIQKQKESFEMIEKVKHYQKSILTLQQTLNDTILQKQQYEYLLAELRQEYELYRKEKEQQVKYMQKKKDHELITANKTILQQNSKLNSQLIELKDENARLNKQLQEKINERTIYRRKATQNDLLIQEKDLKILSLEKECNHYKVNLEDIQKSFEELVKNDQLSNTKILSLQQQRNTLRDLSQRLKKVNDALEKENNQYRQSSNALRMENQALNKKVLEYQQVKSTYEQVNIELRMKNIELQECINQTNQDYSQLKDQSTHIQKINLKLQKLNQELASKQQQLSAIIQSNSQHYQELLNKLRNQQNLSQILSNDVIDKEKTISLLKSYLHKFYHLSHLSSSDQAINSEVLAQELIEQHELSKKVFKQPQLLTQKLFEKPELLTQKIDEKPEPQSLPTHNTELNKVNQRQSIIKERQKQLDQTRALLQQKQTQLDERQWLLKQKQQELTQKQNISEQVKTQYEQKLMQLQLKIKTIQNQKIINTEQISTKKEQIEAKLKSLGQKQLLLTQQQKIINHKSIQFSLKQREFADKYTKLTESQKEFAKRQNELTKLLEEITQKQNLSTIILEEITQKENSIASWQSNLQQKQSQMTDLQKRLQAQQESTLLKQQQLQKIHQQILATQSLLAQQSSAIVLKETEVQNRLSSLTVTDKELKLRQDQLNERHLELKNRQTQIVARQLQLDSKQQELELRGLKIRQQQKQVDERWQVLKNEERLVQEIKERQHQQQVAQPYLQKEEKQSEVNIVHSDNSQFITFDQFLTPSDSIPNSLSHSPHQSQYRSHKSQSQSHKSQSQSLKSQPSNNSNHLNNSNHHNLGNNKNHQSYENQGNNVNQKQKVFTDEIKQNSIYSQNSLYSVVNQTNRALSQKIKTLFTPQGDDLSANQDYSIMDEENNPMNLAQLYSDNKLIGLVSHNELPDPNQQKWLTQINAILTSLLNQSQTQPPINNLSYFDAIKDNYNKLLSRQLRTAPLNLDLSDIDFKNSVSSPLSFSGHKFFGLRFNSDIDNTQEKQKEDSKQVKEKDDGFRFERSKTDQISPHDLSLVTEKVKIQHLSEVKLLLFNKLQQKQTQNEVLRARIKQMESQTVFSDQIQQLQSKLYTFESFQNLQNDEMKVGVLWNLFKQIITSYNEDDLEKFERICRILFKMLKYPQKDIEMFDIECENRKKQKKVPSFFTKLTRSLSQQKKSPKPSISPSKK